MVPERVPSELGNKAMVLMCIAVPVRENNVRLHSALYLLEEILDVASCIGKKTVPEFLQNDFFSQPVVNSSAPFAAS